MTNIILNVPANPGATVFSSVDMAALAVQKVLPNVDNTHDIDKPVSTAQQAALNLKANLISPSLVTPLLDTPTSGILTNCTGTAAGLTAGNVTTNANLTGDIASVGNATTLQNAPVIAKVLTGYVAAAGTVAATDSILSAIQKVDANDALKQPVSGKDISGGYAGLTLLAINFKNAANTFTNSLTNATTAARTYTFPDYSGTVAMLSDFITSLTNIPAGGISSTTVQEAINELDTKKVAVASIIGTCSQVAGVPTGALMEHGNNATGEWWRYAGGMQISLINVGAISYAANASTSTGEKTYPAAFAATPIGVASTTPSNNYDLYGVISVEPGTSSINCVVRNGAIAQLITVAIFLVGRWY